MTFDSQEVKNTYGKITTMLGDALSKPAPTNAATNTPPVSHTMLDLLLLLLPYLPSVPARQLFDQALTAQWMENSDPGVQKRSYRLLARCLDSGVLVKGGANKTELIDQVVKRIGETAEKVAQGAQKVRQSIFTLIRLS